MSERPISLALIVSPAPSGLAGGSVMLRETLVSAVDRAAGNQWDEVIVVSGGSDDGVSDDRAPGVLPSLPLKAGAIVSKPIAAARWTVARSEFIVFVPAGSLITTGATNKLRELIIHNPTVDLAYFDSTGYRLETPSQLLAPSHRPGFSPERLRSQMYLGEMVLVRRTVAESFDPSGGLLNAPLQHGTACRLTARCATIAHIPQVLYRSPVVEPLETASTEAKTAGPGPAIRSATSSAELADHQQWLRQDGFPATARAGGRSSSIIDLEPRLLETPPVSIIIPTNGADRELHGVRTTLCLQAIDSVIAETGYIDYELVVVITPGAPEDLANQILATIEARTGARRPTVRFCRDERPFNFSNACNCGAVSATGEVLVFLNDDTVVKTADWLERLVMYATRPAIGAVGARLHYGDGSIQHAGIWSRGGHPVHRYERSPGDHTGYLDSLLVPQNCLAVTGACLAVTAEKFNEVGGFSPEFPSSYNDVDLCLKLDDVGYRTVVDPGVILTHYEASSRDPKIDDWELALLHDRWRSVLVNDPYDNPHHLAPGSEEFPPPDALITEQKRQAGWVDFPPRLWPRPRLTVDPTSNDHRTEEEVRC